MDENVKTIMSTVNWDNDDDKTNFEVFIGCIQKLLFHNNHNYDILGESPQYPQIS